MSLKTDLSRKHEDDLATLVPGGRRVVASGSKRESHDVYTPDGDEWWKFRYEAKCTQRGSYSLKLSDWKDLEAAVYSRSANERPAWAVRFYGHGEADAPVLKDLVAVDANDWVELLEELERLRGRQQIPKTD